MSLCSKRHRPHSTAATRTNLSAGPNSSPELSSSAPDPPPPPGCQESFVWPVQLPIARPDLIRPDGRRQPGLRSSGPRGSPEKKKCGDVLPQPGPLQYPEPRHKTWPSRDLPEGRRREGPTATGRAARLPEATGGARIAGAGAATAGRTRPSASRHLRHRAGVFAAPAGCPQAVGPSTGQRLSEGAWGRRRPVGPAGWALLRQLPSARGGSVK